jgi:hypothetical protein
VTAEFEPVFASLRALLARFADRLHVAKDGPEVYSLVTRKPSPFPQHKGHPMDFGSVKAGKAYVSLHLMPIYMSSTLTKDLTPGLKKRMHGKTCFQFKSKPDRATLVEIESLIARSLESWQRNSWV